MINIFLNGLRGAEACFSTLKRPGRTGEYLSLDFWLKMCYNKDNKGDDTMDELKKETVKDYTAWDLNCPRYVKPKGGHKLKKIFKRKARRKMKKEDKTYV